MVIKSKISFASKKLAEHWRIPHELILKDIEWASAPGVWCIRGVGGRCGDSSQITRFSSCLNIILNKKIDENKITIFFVSIKVSMKNYLHANTYLPQYFCGTTSSLDSSLHQWGLTLRWSSVSVDSWRVVCARRPSGSPGRRSSLQEPTSASAKRRLGTCSGEVRNG